MVQDQQINYTSRHILPWRTEKEFDALLGKLIESRENTIQPNEMAEKFPKSDKKYTRIDPQLKANLNWIKPPKVLRR